MASIIFAVPTLVGYGGCTSSFCLFTFDYLYSHAETLCSFRFYEVFPWGWGKETASANFLTDGQLDILGAADMSLAYTSTTLLILALLGDAHRNAKLGAFSLFVLVGILFCFGALLPSYLLWRGSGLRLTGQIPARSGTYLMWAQLTTMCTLAISWYAAKADFNPAVNGGLIWSYGVFVPLVAVLVMCTDAGKKFLSATTVKRFFLLNAALAALFEVYVCSHAPGSAGIWQYLLQFSKRTFIFDSLGLRITSVLLLLWEGYWKCGVAEVLLFPVGLCFGMAHMAGKAEDSNPDTGFQRLL